jgi:hypothetical protein
MAAREAVLFARRCVHQPLTGEVAYRIYPNQSFDGNPRVGDEVVFPDDMLPTDEFHGPWSAKEAVAYLWRHGKVPEWIDVSVEAEDGQTLVALRCCGRFTASEELLYYRNGGFPPFGIKSPVLPPGWESPETSDRFDLHWQAGRSTP